MTQDEEVPARPASLPVTPGSPGARVLGVGAYRPRRTVDNDELSLTLDTSDEWIRSRTGIVSRNVAGDGESVAEMGAEAGAKALAHAGMSPQDVDLVLAATSSLDFPMPQAAMQIAFRLGAGRDGGAPGYDIGAACAGFCYALGAAADAVRAGTARHVLVVGTERFTDLLDPADRGTVPIFADGAGAVVVGASPENGIGPLVAASDGSRGNLIARAEHAAVLAMDGPAVFRWATTAMAPYARAAVAAAGLEIADLGGVVFHQANVRIIDAIARALNLPEDAVVARSITTDGNTSAASIPLALDALVARGDLAHGTPLLLLGFGAGLAVAGQVVLSP